MKINATELATILAHEKVIQEMDAIGLPIYEDVFADELTYTEEAQDIFNEEYDKYWDMIISTAEYPFKEGDPYYIILKNKDRDYGLHTYDIMKSVWDDISEEIYLKDVGGRDLFKTREDAQKHIDMLTKDH